MVCLPGIFYNQMHLLVEGERDAVLVPDMAAQVAGARPTDLTHQHAHVAGIVAEDAALRTRASAAPHEVAVTIEGEREAVFVVEMVLQLGPLKQDHFRANLATAPDKEVNKKTKNKCVTVGTVGTVGTGT